VSSFKFKASATNKPVDKATHKFTGPALCSECNPSVGKWHGRFKKETADGLVLATDGFLYSKEYTEHETFKWRMRNQNLGIMGEETFLSIETNPLDTSYAPSASRISLNRKSTG